jgi:hypothetical protein
MLLDRGLRLAFRNFSTLFLIVATVTFPLQIAYGYVFRDVLAVSELHPVIEGSPNYRMIKGVNADRLASARRAFALTTVVEIAALGLLLGAARRVLETDARDEVPGAFQSWRGVNPSGFSLRREGLASVVIAVLFAALIGVLIEATGKLLLEAVPDDVLWAGSALVHGAARAAAAPFALATAVVAWGLPAPDNRPGESVSRKAHLP